MKKAILFLLILLLIISSCSVITGINEEEKPEEFYFTKSEYTVSTGKRLYLSVTCVPVSILKRNAVSFLSSDENIVFISDIDETGILVVAQEIGQAVITAEINSVKTRCIINVEE